LRLGKVGYVLQLSIVGPTYISLAAFHHLRSPHSLKFLNCHQQDQAIVVVELPEAASAESKKAPEYITALSGPVISSTVMAAVLTRPSSLQTGSDAPVKYDAAQLKLLSLVV
jgi:hypothetical protein